MTNKPYYFKPEVYKGDSEELFGRFQLGATLGGVCRAMSARQGCGCLKDSDSFMITLAC